MPSKPKLDYDSSHNLGISLVSSRKTRNKPLIRVFAYLLLLVIASLLAVTIPSPWSVVRTYKHLKSTSNPITKLSSPADEWKDDVWPIRPQTPWDISTDFPYPRTLEFDVQEGTWLRLDVHPTSGDIVFDMIGDLYCVPASEVYPSRGIKNARARPILLGVPHDADAHFSPSGDQLVFRSDAELGLDNIWMMPWSGCDAMDVRPPGQIQDVALASALSSKKEDEELLANNVPETEARKTNRLLREGRFKAIRVTNETFRFVTDARFHSSGTRIVATKWYTGSRSVGAGEAWEYNVSSSVQPGSIPVGSGKRLIGRTLPPGWDASNYNEQQIGSEQHIWRGDDEIIFAKNVRDQSTFEYSKDVHQGIYSIFSHNLTTKRTSVLVDAFPGGASRPELSRDRRTLAFVRRFRDYGVLVLKDLQTGTIRHIWHGLDYDVSGIYAPMGTYPSFAFTPSDDAIVIWASGHINIVPLTVNSFGEKIKSDSPYPIKFTAHVEKRLAETRKIDGEFDLAAIETADTMRVTAFKTLRVDSEGKKVTFEAAGVTFVQHVGEDKPISIPVLHNDGMTPYYSPSFIDGMHHTWVIHSSWSDIHFTSFELANIDTGHAFKVYGLPMGRYLSPIVGKAEDERWKIAFVKTGGDYLTGDIVATAGAGLYVGDLNLSMPEKRISKLQFIPSDINTEDHVDIRFTDGNSKLLVQQSRSTFIIDLEASPDGDGKPPHHTLASGRMSSEMATVLTSGALTTSPILDKLLGERKDKSQFSVGNVAFVDSMQVYLAPGKSVKEGEKLWSKPGNATKGLVRLSVDGGHDLAWSGHGTTLFWFLGPYLHSVEVSKLQQCSSAVEEDPLNFGISCVKNLVKYQEIVIEHSTDIARLKQEAVKADTNTLVLYNATILTMETGDIEKDLIDGGVIVLNGGVIQSAGPIGSTDIPDNALVIQADGGYVVPGFIDAHAHWNGFGNPHPAKSWEMETFLAYGVTTLHNPSAASRDGYAERSRLERGHFVGPRIFQTGEVIYGAGIEELHQDIADMTEARSALIRIKAEGGKASTSYKNYQLPSRASRQRLLLAARNLSMLCVPEGGMNYDWDLTYIIDGMTTVEHAVPIPKLYEDALKLFAWSGTGNTPTHIVNYGGPMGEQLVWATEDIPNDPKLRRFSRHDILESVTESRARPITSYALFNTSASVAELVKIGNGTFRTHIGAHGEPPLGVIYHAEMLFTAGGGYSSERTGSGLSSYETLQAATSWAAQTFGLFNSLGSVSTGKLADLVIYPTGIDLLAPGGLERSRELKYVVRGGRIWDAEVMEEVWPVRKKKQTMPPFNAD